MFTWFSSNSSVCPGPAIPSPLSLKGQFIFFLSLFAGGNTLKSGENSDLLSKRKEKKAGGHRQSPFPSPKASQGGCSLPQWDSQAAADLGTGLTPLYCSGLPRARLTPFENCQPWPTLPRGRRPTRSFLRSSPMLGCSHCWHPLVPTHRRSCTSAVNNILFTSRSLIKTRLNLASKMLNYIVFAGSF